MTYIHFLTRMNWTVQSFSAIDKIWNAIQMDILVRDFSKTENFP